jgi:DNA replication protein DnaC
MNDKDVDGLSEGLRKLNLTTMLNHHEQLAEDAARSNLGYLPYLKQLTEIEIQARCERSIARKIKNAGFPLIKTLEQFNWSWPASINRQQIQDLFRLRFIDHNANVILMGGVGLGKTHLATALAHAACLNDISVLFTSAVDIVNTLSAAQAIAALPKALKRYTTPRLLVIDELGYMPMDKRGSDLLFQVVSARYERGSIVLTTNAAYKQWPRIFDNDSTITAAVLDRLLHHCDTITIEGRSYRMKDHA